MTTLEMPSRLAGGRVSGAGPPWRWGVALVILTLFVVPALHLRSQPTAPDSRVLKLDGKNACVALPDKLFVSLTESTVEVWVKIERWRGAQFEVSHHRCREDQAPDRDSRPA
jgi:hypothetical protein